MKQYLLVSFAFTPWTVFLIILAIVATMPPSRSTAQRATETTDILATASQTVAPSSDRATSEAADATASPTITETLTPSTTPTVSRTPIQQYLPGVLKEPPTPTATLTLTPSRTATSTRQPTATRDPTRCAAEYPTVCIPPPPPDLNCPDIPYRNFRVNPPDRHKFDTDNDGIGCET